MSKLVLITGTSSGIGLSAAIECAAAGHKVVATMRDLDRREALEKAAKDRGVSVDVEQLDVISPGAGDKIRELVLKYGPFFALVNNAGIAIGGPFEEQSEDDVRLQLETNVLGLMATTRAILPSMRSAGRGRIVNVSSTSGRVAMPCLSIYAATKHAVEGFSEALRWELEPFGIDVLVVAPGTFRTPIFFENLKRGAHVADEGPYGALIRRIEDLAIGGARRAPPPDEVGRTIMRLVGEPFPPFRTIVGRDGFAMTTLRGVMPDRLFALGLRRALALSRVR
ncbi:SDR family NAD(P)-dependent oxidoreductase [Polyangium jinanense]|uniref:SDR family NAD(P)-dependent oxidoreductase n=1 Tax=Polyangium jinanense TaxID=2829994 RepID=A0A9X4ASE6_9BACT|nr:SDR family NAD(P)-dependent oxidoreductase [Polyangium jinanense]MDC3955118.1 SDR family NAD(P)-dependent oxidoreductase [Polyangium jinanense]MDC3981112.1 SDR family NAD(P)-dependent oxidoreductase [Polyangium jinanense]